MPYAFENVRATNTFGRRLRDVHRRLVGRVGDVVVIRLVDEDHRVGRRRAHALDEVGHGRRAVHGGRRVVRIAEEHEAGTLRRLDQLVDVDAQVAVERRRRAPRCRSSRAVSRGFSNVGQAVASGLVGEVNARTALVRISPEPAPSDDLVVRDAELLRQRLDQHRLALLRVERVAARLGELADDDVDARAARGRGGSRCWRCE